MMLLDDAFNLFTHFRLVLGSIRAIADHEHVC